MSLYEFRRSTANASFFIQLITPLKLARFRLSPRRLACAPKIQRVHLPTSLRMSSQSHANVRKWRCMSHCGACCKLGDFDKDVLMELLKTEEEVVTYLDMIGSDGWCKLYDSQSRTCMQYENRPFFCRATPEVFQEFYNVDESQFDEFAISCCQYHISNTYGEESMEAFQHDDFIAETNS